MASHAPIRNEKGHLQPPRGRGRPKGSTNLSPEEKRLKEQIKEIDYLRVDNRFNRAEDFYLYVQGYPDKTGLMASLYRQQPKIDVTLIGQEDFAIHKTIDEAEMTKEWVGENWGRGKYMLILGDANRPHGQKEVATTFFDLSNYQKPPVYDPRTLVLSEPKNLDEVNRQINAGVMVRDKNGQVRFRGPEDGPSPLAQPVAVPQPRSSSDLIGDEMVKGIVAKALNGLGNSDSQITHVIEIAKLLQRNDPQISQEQLVEQITQRIETRLTRGNGTGDIFENYERVETFFKKFAPVNAVGSGDGGAGAYGTIRLIVGDIVGAIPQVIAGLAQLQQLRNQEPRRPHPMRRVNPPAVEGQQPAGPQQPPQALMTVQERAVEVVNMAFDALARGTTGRDFASFLFYFHPGGDEILDLLASQGSSQAVMGLIAMSPDMSKLVTPQNRDNVEKFLGEVLNWQPDGVPEETPVEV